RRGGSAAEAADGPRRRRAHGSTATAAPAAARDARTPAALDRRAARRRQFRLRRFVEETAACPLRGIGRAVGPALACGGVAAGRPPGDHANRQFSGVTGVSVTCLRSITACPGLFTGLTVSVYRSAFSSLNSPMRRLTKF